MNHDRNARLRLTVLALTVVLGLIACAVDLSGGDVPRHGWWGKRGLVVPHESFPADCTLCHVGDDWLQLRDDFEFDHEAEAGVALVGAHNQAECLRCHNDRGPVSLFAARGCAGCHEDVHRGQLGKDCRICHDEETWRAPEEIARHGRTRFPLVGAHAATPCRRCHPGAEVGEFTRADVECASCHQGDLARATDPDHVGLGWVESCDRCHIPTTWDGGGFNHPGFELTGAHRAADCTACHAGGIFSGLPTNCAACHLAEFQGTSDPDHVANGFPRRCDLCHDTNGWDGAMFSHAGISNGCVQCHLVDYQNTDDPDHVAGNFPTDCEQCHNTNAWDGAMFSHIGITNGCVECHLVDYQNTTDPDHVAGGFPTDCEQCHDTNTWEGAMFSHIGIRSGCVECHLTDYENTTDPDHAAAGFPPVCELCHDTVVWENGTFDHRFPINSGRHSGFDCIDCHLNPRNYNDFSCIDCHEHNRRDTNDDHDRVPNYRYDSDACYACHPNGSR